MVWSRTHRLWLLTSLAIVALVAGVVANAWFWPVTYLGYTTDLVSGVVIEVEPGGIAARAGLQTGDQITAIYGLPYTEALAHWNIAALLAPNNGPVPMVVARDGETVALQLDRGPPPLAFQRVKLVTALLALICWLTGWLLGLVRRHEASASPTVAAFWVGMGGALGVYQFARFVSFPLLAIIQWLFLVILTPLGVYVHLRFPARPVAERTLRLARRLLLTIWLLGTALFVGALTLGSLSVPELVIAAAPLLPLAFCLSFVGSGALLFRAYRHAQITHLRRQIRLIAAACLFVGGAWLVVLVIPVLQGSLPTIAGAGGDLLAGLVPLAYLVSGVMPNLYHLDRLVRRIGVLLTTMGAMALLLAAAAVLLPAGWRTLGLIVLSASVYRPVRVLAGRLFVDRDRSYAPLHTAAHRLTSSLDARVLAAVFLGGLRDTFHCPRCGLYLAEPGRADRFRLVLQADASELPAMVELGPLLHLLARQPGIHDARSLHEQLQFAKLPLATAELLHAQDIALWGTLRHAPDTILGLVVLGADRRLDPYQVEDLREIRRLLDAAALAFTNSATYQQKCDAEAIIRDLYHEVRRVQDETAAALARELHDEVININVRLNIQSLRKILGQNADPALLDELRLLLEGEENTAEALRVICERLHPSGLDDPMGLPNLLRLQVERAETMWPGACRLAVCGELLPLDRRQQHEAMRIVREAVTNAVKHAEATTILVTLRYPERAGEDIVVTVEDNGRHGAVIQPRPGHRGILDMEESATAAGGRIAFEHPQSGGTRLVFTFPPRPPEPLATRSSAQWGDMGDIEDEHAI